MSRARTKAKVLRPIRPHCCLLPKLWEEFRHLMVTGKGKEKRKIKCYYFPTMDIPSDSKRLPFFFFFFWMMCVWLGGRGDKGLN